MTTPHERWPALAEPFAALHEDWSLSYDSEDEAILDWLDQMDEEELREALREWQDAFAAVSDEDVQKNASGFSPSYDPRRRFGGYRGWAEWVREHLEREIAKRGQDDV